MRMADLSVAILRRISTDMATFVDSGEISEEILDCFIGICLPRFSCARDNLHG